MPNPNSRRWAEPQRISSRFFHFLQVKRNRVAALTYQHRKIEEGKCYHSVRYCETHLTACRDRARVKSKKTQQVAARPALRELSLRWAEVGEEQKSND